MADLSYREALADIGVAAAMQLELTPEDLATVRRCVPLAALALALGMAEDDPQWSTRWAAASGWVDRGEIIHEALLWILTPETEAFG